MCATVQTWMYGRGVTGLKGVRDVRAALYRTGPKRNRVIVTALRASEPIHHDRTTARKGEPTMATEAYCVKCREKREMQDEEVVTMKNGRPALKGVCPVCGTKLFRLQSTKKEAAPAS